MVNGLSKFVPERDLYDPDPVEASQPPQDWAKLAVLVKALPLKNEKDIHELITKSGNLSLGSGLPKKNFGTYFRRKIEKYGPGLLLINHPQNGPIAVIMKQLFNKKIFDVPSTDLAVIQMSDHLSRDRPLSLLMDWAVKDSHFIQMTDQKTWDKREKEQEFVVPDLSKRLPPIGENDTVRWSFDLKTSTYETHSIHGYGSIVPKNDPHFLIKTYPMKFLQAPPHFTKDSLAITEDNKHVLQQQAQRSCVPTAAAMLILDHGKTPDWKSIIDTNISQTATYVPQLIREANLEPIISSLPDENKAAALESLLQKNGPAVTSVSVPGMGGHAIVIDRVFSNTDEADIRDPYHGVALRVRLKTLLSWKPGAMIQVAK